MALQPNKAKLVLLVSLLSFENSFKTECFIWHKYILLVSFENSFKTERFIWHKYIEVFKRRADLGYR